MVKVYFQFQAQKLGLTAQFGGEIKTWIRRLAALPLVPINRLDEAFFWIQGEAPDTENTVSMHDYIVETFINDNALFPK